MFLPTSFKIIASDPDNFNVNAISTSISFPQISVKSLSEIEIINALKQLKPTFFQLQGKCKKFVLFSNLVLLMTFQMIVRSPYFLTLPRLLKCPSYNRIFPKIKNNTTRTAQI